MRWDVITRLSRERTHGIWEQSWSSQLLYNGCERPVLDKLVPRSQGWVRQASLWEEIRISRAMGCAEFWSSRRLCAFCLLHSTECTVGLNQRQLMLDTFCWSGSFLSIWGTAWDETCTFSAIITWYLVTSNFSWAKLHSLFLGLSHSLLQQIPGEIKGTSAWVKTLNVVQISGLSNLALQVTSPLTCPEMFASSWVWTLKTKVSQTENTWCRASVMKFLISEMTYWLHSIFIYAFSVLIQEWKQPGIVWVLNDFLNTRKTNSKSLREMKHFPPLLLTLFSLLESDTAPQRLMKLYVDLFSSQFRHSLREDFLPRTAIDALL